MKKVTITAGKSFLPVLLVGFAVTALGVLSIVYKEFFISMVVIAIGCGSLGQGVYTVIHVGKWGFTGNARSFAFARGIILILIGICSIFLPLAVAENVTAILCYIFAAGLIVSSFFTIQNAVACRFVTGLSCGSFVAEALLDMLFAIVLILNPQSFMVAAVSIIGISLIVIGVFLIILAFCTRKSGVVSKCSVIDVSDAQDV